MKGGMRKHVYLCNEDCNHCEAIRNRQVSLALDTLSCIYGDDVTAIVNEICPNLTCCADCHVDDFTHWADDDGSPLCEIEEEARRIARRWKRAMRKRDAAKQKKGGAE